MSGYLLQTNIPSAGQSGILSDLLSRIETLENRVLGAEHREALYKARVEELEKRVACLEQAWDAKVGPLVPSPLIPPDLDLSYDDFLLEASPSNELFSDALLAELSTPDVPSEDFPDLFGGIPPLDTLPTPTAEDLDALTAFFNEPPVPPKRKLSEPPSSPSPPAKHAKTSSKAPRNIVPPAPHKKRQAHGLRNQLVPSNVQLPPGIPITDYELLTFLFDHVKRPLIAHRLKLNGWGPKAIKGVLDAHRDIDPPMLRNTIGIKLSTEMRLGREVFGEEWGGLEEGSSPYQGDDTSAFALPVEESVDCRIVDVARGVVRWPVGENEGVFTRCVRWCVENGDEGTMMSEMKVLAERVFGPDAV